MGTLTRSGRSEAYLTAKWQLISLRKTLEANMTHSELFPPGDVLWLVNPGEVVLPGEEGRVQSEPRLFRVNSLPST